MALKYVGKGAWIPGIPSRDLNDDEVKQFGEAYLLKSGLYVKESKKPRGGEDKSSSGPSESKEE